MMFGQTSRCVHPACLLACNHAKEYTTVPLPPLGTSEFTEQLTQLDAHIPAGLEQSQQQQQEIRLLLGQTASEVEKAGSA